MSNLPRRSTACLAVLLLASAIRSSSADETSASDKLRILYANRFTFTNDKLPLITVEIASGIKSTTLSSKSGLLVRPDGNGGSSIASNATEPWRIHAEDTKPAIVMDWTIVETFGPEDATGVNAALTRWRDKGFDPKPFEIGSVFGVDGEVIDSRETRIAIDPVAEGKGAARAAELAQKLNLPTFVHQELVQRPTGVIVAEHAGTTIRNPSVIWFESSKLDETITVAAVPAGTGGSQLQTSKEDRRYWGSVYVTLSHDGNLVVANAVSEDKLLAGIVPSEMFPGAPDAALEAQAIAARTELLQKIGRRNLTDPFLLCSTQQCQVYAGAGKEQARTTRAVEKTRGIVLLRNGGGMVDVRYSASCGGHSEHNDTVWGGDPDPSLRGHRDTVASRSETITSTNISSFLAEDPKKSWCGRPALAQNRFRWAQTLTIDALNALVAASFPSVGRVIAITPDKRGISGRIKNLTIRGEKGSVEVVGELKIRRLLGGLKSSLFVVDTQGPMAKPTAFVFRGAGFGHGVGMCQMGAIGMAEAGKHHREILKQYYLGTHLHKLY